MRTTTWFGSYSSCPIEAITYLINSGITDSAIKSAVCTLVQFWIDNGVYSKIDAFYPMVGNNASQNKLNLINPLDSDSAFRRTFAGGITFDIMGESGNGVNGQSNTFYSPLNEVDLSTGAFIILNNNINNIGGVDIFSNASIRHGVVSRYTDNNFYASALSNSSIGMPISNVSAGSFLTVREPLKNNEYYNKVNGFYLLNNVAFAIGAGELQIHAFVNEFKSSRMTGLILGKNATVAEVDIIEAGLIAFNTTLGRLW